MDMYNMCCTIVVEVLILMQTKRLPIKFPQPLSHSSILLS